MHLKTGCVKSRYVRHFILFYFFAVRDSEWPLIFSHERKVKCNNLPF
uniref:Uncharacterized protein n=1 Tax=Anguilla anguilla TaxID=7936 RepID=A0A0E9WFH6_ANGAN